MARRGGCFSDTRLRLDSWIRSLDGVLSFELGLLKFVAQAVLAQPSAAKLHSATVVITKPLLLRGCVGRHRETGRK